MLNANEVEELVGHQIGGVGGLDLFSLDQGVSLGIHIQDGDAFAFSDVCVGAYIGHIFAHGNPPAE